MTSMKDHYLKKLRGRANDLSATRIALSELRSRSSPSQFPGLIKSLRRACPKFVSRHCVNGKPSFSELGWDGHLEPLTFKDELAFASAWLSPYAVQIKSFRDEVLEIQALVLDGELPTALDRVRKNISLHGWSFWLAEIQYALVQLVNGDAGRQAMTQALVEGASPRIAALFAQIFNDRNDGLFSFDNFISKCRDSFPNLSLSETTKEYLSYRALNQVSSAPDGMAKILSTDILSSLPDYYESLIDACATAAIYSTDEETKNSVKSSLAMLESNGFSDHRINKIYLMLGDSAAFSTETLFRINGAHYAKEFLLGYVDSSSHHRFVSEQIKEDISVIIESGSAAEESISRIIKFGANIRGLDVGVAVASLAASTSNDIFSESIISPWIMFVSEGLSLRELLWMGVERLAPLAIPMPAESLEEGSQFLEMIQVASSDRNLLNPNSLAPLYQLWLARELALQGRKEDAAIITLHFGLSKILQRGKLKIDVFLADQESLSEALTLASRGILEDVNRAFELPLKHLFSLRKWRDFQGINLVTVGCVAHFAYLSTSDPKIRFLCRMACRKFHDFLADETPAGSPEWYTLDGHLLHQLIVFLRYVWAGENLSMLDVESTQELRRERLKALQILLTLDNNEENSADYAEEIKDITFQETIWNGLKNIDETRVFVNEAAILRWANNELREDFERYVNSVNSSTGSSIPDAIVRSYLIEPNSELLLQSLGSDYTTESGILLIGLINRLRSRFLNDPMDGLNCYLSSRIRHGSLKGTILGPLEEAGIIGVKGIDVADTYTPDGTPAQKAAIAVSIEKFNERVGGLIDELLFQRVQIRSTDHPKGAIFVPLDTNLAVPLFEDLAKASTFQQFVTACFDMYWITLRDPLLELAEHITHDFKDKLQTEFDRMIEIADRQKDIGRGLSTLCRTLATATKSQCDIVADWFLIEKNTESQTYSFEEAVEIAVSATRRVYRRFSTQISMSKFTSPVRLTAYGLAVVVDALYITFGNAWNRSGMGERIDCIIVDPSFNLAENILTLKVTSPLSYDVFEDLRSGKLETLRRKYLDALPIDLIPKEGGSGLAKLAGVARSAKSEHCLCPLDFGLTEDCSWYVSVSIQLYRRGEAYDAYE